MKKLLIFAALITATCLLNGNVAFDVGFYAPKDSKVNVLWGLEFFNTIDERVSMGMTVNYFYRSFRKGSYSVEPPSNQYENGVVGTDAKVTTVFFPMYAGFKVHLPFESLPVVPFAGADFGWGFTWKSYDAYIEQDGRDRKGTDFYHGFTWRINAGATYPLGTMSDVYVKVFYNDASFEQSESVRKWKEFDMSGMSVGLGIRFKY